MELSQISIQGMTRYTIYFKNIPLTMFSRYRKIPHSRKFRDVTEYRQPFHPDAENVRNNEI